MNNPTLGKALLVLLLLGFCCAHAFAQETDYVPYHESINAAEEAFFLAEDCEAALQRYREAFSEYSYVFARDAINAVLKDAMRKGEIHPREIALIYDNQFGNHKGCLKDDEPDYPYFKLHLFVNYRTLTERTNAEINEFRSAWHLVPLEVDEAKKRYEENLGFSLIWGFWGCL